MQYNHKYPNASRHIPPHSHPTVIKLATQLRKLTTPTDSVEPKADIVAWELKSPQKCMIKAARKQPPSTFFTKEVHFENFLALQIGIGE